ncbi:hypothetical protein WR25_06793 [Diploscapter pachys]|uniref:EST1-like DNA-binding domain-containing protein n=1 Tax=Diploscapter pachys TaxID=2018661 RepID=A0A2A2KYN0_9BILA|nr:hypothetical protein WR25_06793 [Diploscapter pachys]
MEKIGRYCLELKKTLDVEDPDSDKARAFRKKILKLLLEFEQTSDDQKGLELFWRVAYRDPVQTIKRRKVDTKYSSKIITEFINELRNQMKTGTKHAAVFSLYIGDLHRYMNSNQALIRAFYKKAISIDPDLGHAFNQLALTDTHIMSLRHWMMALTVEKPFALALQNVEKTLKEKFDDPMEERVAELVKLTTIQYKKIELQRHSELWTEALEDVENLESHPQLPLLLNVFSMSAMLSPSQMGYDVFLGATQLLCETFRCLLQKIQCAVEVDSDINVHRARRRRRRESGDDENESSGDEEGEGKNDEDAKGQKEENNKMDMKKNLEMLLLATACEWMYYADDVLNNGLEKSGTPIPSAFRDLYDDVVSILMDKLNGLLDTIKKYEEDVDEELSWLIYGPILESNNPKSPRPLRQLIYWAYQLTSQTESPIQFRDYFKKRDKSSKQANGRENIAQKMAELHIRQKQATSLEWLPVYVIYDTSVLEKHSNLARDLIFSRHFISVLPSFVLSIIDKMKTSNETIRSTLRLIERAQKRDRLQIVKANAHEECAKYQLFFNRKRDVYVIKFSAMVIYQIEGFHDRFHKAVSSRASVGVS